METLQPCPFCGSTKLDYSLKTSGAGYHAVVYCKTCHTYGPRVLIKHEGDTYPDRYKYERDETIKQKAAELWNNRK